MVSNSHTESYDLGPVHASVVPMTRKHLNAVMEIDAETSTTPWSIGLFTSELLLEETRRYTVAVVDGLVVGFCGVMYVVDEAHITTVAVSTKWQKKKIGTHLIADALWASIESGSKSAGLEVRFTNVKAQHLYAAFGFVPSGVRKNYYPDTKEDALVMWLSDLDGEESRDRLTMFREKLSDVHQEWKS